MTGRNTKIIGAGLVGASILAAVFLRSVDDEQPSQPVPATESEIAANNPCWREFFTRRDEINARRDAALESVAGDTPEAVSRILAEANDATVAAENQRIACNLER